MTKEEIYKEIEDIFKNEGINVKVESNRIEGQHFTIDFNNLKYIGIYNFENNHFYLSLDDIEKIVNLLKELELIKAVKYYRVQLLPETDYYNHYLNYDESDGSLFLSNIIDGVPSIKTKFTEEEYNKLFARYPEFLPEFNKNDTRFIEVNQDEHEIKNEGDVD